MYLLTAKLLYKIFIKYYILDIYYRRSQKIDFICLGCGKGRNMNQPSICIPRVNIGVTSKNIREIISKCYFGSIRQIDFIHKRRSSTVFIHFFKWNETAENYRQKLLDGEFIYIGYFLQPEFWKCCAVEN